MSTTATIPIVSPTKKGSAYLEIVPRRNTVTVQQTELGRRSLNKFWPAWMRHLVLTKHDQRGGFAVELRGSMVIVSASASQNAITETVRALAQQIVPIANPPIRRDDWCTPRQMMWKIDDGTDLTDCLKALSLPRHADIKVHEGWFMLERDAKNPFKIGQLAMMTECQVALHCRS